MSTLHLHAGCVLALGVSAAAHDPGLSSCSVTLAPGRTELVLQLANADAAIAIRGLDADHDGVVSVRELAQGALVIRSFVAKSLVVGSVADGIPSSDIAFELEANHDVQVRVTLPVLTDGRLELRWVEDLPRGHREYFVAKRADGTLVREALLARGAFSVDLEGLTTAPVAGSSFVMLGIEHVLTGYDHVLFLLGLLLVARRVRAALGVITAFTVAHSLTLALATFDLVRLPGALVETTIALSIVWVGVENLLIREPVARWRCTFLFGLVHGFGFATVLQELGIGRGPRGVVMPLLEFNIGVELGQLAIAAVALPLFARLRDRLRIPGSWIVVAAGVWWTVTRLATEA